MSMAVLSALSSSALLSPADETLKKAGISVATKRESGMICSAPFSFLSAYNYPSSFRKTAALIAVFLSDIFFDSISCRKNEAVHLPDCTLHFMRHTSFAQQTSRKSDCERTHMLISMLSCVIDYLLPFAVHDHDRINAQSISIRPHVAQGISGKHCCISRLPAIGHWHG